MSSNASPWAAIELQLGRTSIAQAGAVRMRATHPLRAGEESYLIRPLCGDFPDERKRV